MKKILPYLPWLVCIAIAVMMAQRGRARNSSDEVFIASGRDDEAAREFDTEPYTSEHPPAAELDAIDDSAMPVGNRLVMQAIRQLRRRKSVSARLRHQVSLHGNRFFGAGSYAQQGQGEDMQVRLELQFAGTEANFVQATNGRSLWTDQRLPTGRVVTHVELHELRRALEADSDGTGRHVNGGAPNAGAGGGLPLVAEEGGLPGLLASLGEQFQFLPPQSMRLRLAQPLVTEPIEITVFAVVGHWRAEKLSDLFKSAHGLSGETQVQAAAGAESPAVVSSPERIPQEVLLLIGQEDLFPYRVEYRRPETSLDPSSRSPTAVYQLSADPIAVLELTDVVFDAPIAAAKFDYTPGTANFTDETAIHVERLVKARRANLARQGAANASAPR
jgi:hypothetical protein